jgi:hypothetical protein
MQDKLHRLYRIVVCVALLSITGCETVKGLAQGTADGFKKDWQAVMKADSKMREVLW